MFTYILILLICILCSNIISRFIPFLSVPIVQIVMGALISIIYSEFKIELDPHTFLVMFIAPLLFCDGKKADKRSLWKQRKNILLMALALVAVTVILVGLLINQLIPAISLPVAFALAAALSPTDYVAVSGLSKKISLPKRIIHLIEGEGLMNDASGLVCFKFALAAAVTGTFSLLNATTNFLMVSIGGIITGLVLEHILINFERWIKNLGMEDTTVEILLQILTPFIIYIISEEVFKVSGILAVVVAGMIFSLSSKKLRGKNAKSNAISSNTWSVIVYILNGFIFIIVGLQLPNIIKTAFKETSINNMMAIIDILLITLALLIIRFLWVIFMYKFWGEKCDVKEDKFKFHAALLTSLSGVRGAVTLATVLSIPLVLDNGQEFPQRTLILFLAVGVILVTLFIATFILPIFAKRDKTEDINWLEALNKAQIRVWSDTINKLKLEIDNKKYIHFTINEYRYRINQLKHGNSYYKNWNRSSKEYKKWMNLCYKKEIENTKKLLQEEKIEESTAYAYEKIVRNKIKLISSVEGFSLIVKETLERIYIYIHDIRRIRDILREMQNKKKSKQQLKDIALKELQATNAEYIIEYAKSNITSENEEMLKEIILYYQGVYLISNKLRLAKKNKYEKKKADIKAMQLERNIIQSLFENGEISWNIASALRKNLNYIESDILR
ncbi:sodium, potassium, lithium and rubidium/H(+) antiporter [Clostridium saccharobutylicum]|uniref:Na+/H+ antiporter n=1 Tax=Clostridium saccharobutylicum TaxID=169679 RepID=UPI0009839766|nr:Na+/H+ antiporter [Clostridium saccharobutylicum]AQS08860.1 sodium, potassium, lithium and rubidium/H(+) antiporter [Clostridium saccharobutylicum]MBC2437783.1 Na+/H+ antiporter [Clostridium saccharobutylicum]NSB90208.1 CPA1 family monovalent cation:H+ antiporter [Clostridium saccharobutylicum]NYC28792.1 CPA1 family monovalent cation:H+ antiporter [Clostridium saccharobutylicum]OOM14741.1 sodium, potassium, lithium and rubidium/H(+) antiporter [Clostridium saccharobutylicum]